MITPIPHISTTQELQLAKEHWRKEYTETLVNQFDAECMCAEQIEEGDQEATEAFEMVLCLAAHNVAIAHAMKVCAETAYSARVN